MFGFFQMLLVLIVAQGGGTAPPAVLDVDLRTLPVAEEWHPGDPVRELPLGVLPPTTAPGGPAPRG